MIGKIIRKNRRSSKYSHGIDPDEIFLDSTNVAEFNRDQFEGRMEKPIGTKTILVVGIMCVLVLFSYMIRVWDLQIKNGEKYSGISEENRLNHIIMFSNRGNIYDRNNIPLAWNLPKTEETDFNTRQYIDKPGFSNILGYVKYPQKDKAGFYYEEKFFGFEGIEAFYNEELSGKNGLRMIETNALQDVLSESTIRPAEPGKNLTLTIDADVQQKLYESIEGVANQVGFSGGGGVIMDIHTGEVLALTTFPGFDSNLFTNGKDKAAINKMLNDENQPFLNRIIFGLYTPGSIMKPYIALGALNEGVIDPTTRIVSTGKLEIPNPYNPENPSIFTDWKAHGAVNVKEALAVSSNIYFYVVGGGFKDQKGIGINNIEKYLRYFGFGKPVAGRFFVGPEGTIPNPKWKEENFNGDPWRLGDTYFTSIGQYGVQVTPLQVVRAFSAIANGGTVREPVLLKDEKSEVVNVIDEINQKHFQTVREGMRQVVLTGTGKGLNMDSVAIAAKTGTAELGVSKANVNSWVTGFFPYDNPKYAFTIVMEKGKRTNLIGGVAVARQFFDWMAIYKPEYLN